MVMWDNLYLKTNCVKLATWQVIEQEFDMAILQASISLMDRAKKTTPVIVPIGDTGLTGWLADPTTGIVHDLLNAINVMSLGAISGESVSATEPRVSVTVPTSESAFRSSKLTVFYVDATTGAKGHFSIPARDPAHYTTFPGTKDVKFATADSPTSQVAALVTAVQAAVYSEDGNLVTVTSIQVSGRNQG